MPYDFSMPDYVKNALDIFEKSGFKAYLVGGCVRDQIMGKLPKDWDITTDAVPEQIMEIFPNSVPTGIKHGTVTLVFPEHKIIEATTFRIDGDYSDFRRPERVYFSKNIYDDLSRRDFTMNAIAYSLKEGMIDPFGGEADINNKIIRCVGEPEKRFSEDALRMMRAVRFSAVLDFELDPDVLQGINTLSHLLKNISAERIRDEFSKTIISENPEKVYLFKSLNLIKYFLPEMDAVPDDVLKNILSDVRKLDNSIETRLAYLLYRFTGETNAVTKRLRYDNKTCRGVKSIAACLNIAVPESEYAIRLMMADKLLKPGLLKSFKIRETVTPCSLVSQAIYKYNQIIKSNQCTDISALAVNGHDLDKEGIKDGKEKGRILKILLEEVLKDPSLNTHDKLTGIVRQMRRSG